MQKRFPLTVEAAFIESWPGFADLPAPDRHHLTALICSAFRLGQYRHTHYDDAISYHYKVRDKQFGRGRFQKLNRELGLFRIHEHYLAADGDGFTKGYSLTARALLLLESIPLRTTAITDTQGRIVRTPAVNGIEAKDWAGNTRRGKGQLAATFPTDLDGLLALMDEARKWRWHFKDGLQAPASTVLRTRLEAMPDNQTRVLWLTRYAILPLTFTILEADTQHMPRGWTQITYVEYPSGRLYSVGPSLQTAPREVRRTALKGCFDYDVQNCHYHLLLQLAQRTGRDAPAIRDYLARKGEIRQQLADELGIPVKTIKQLLIALIYGSTQTLHGKGAVVRTLGKVSDTARDKADALYRHPVYADLATEIKTLRKPVIESMRRLRKNGAIVNPFGKTIASSKTEEQVLAHVIQGAEAEILDCVLRNHGPVLRLLQHDGWTSAERLDVPKLEATIAAETGFTVAIEEAGL